MDAVMTERPGPRTVGGVVRLVKGDITELDVDAFVYYARPDLALGSGIGGAIAVRGGPAVQKELTALGPAAPGDVVVTGGGKLKARHVLHAVGPRFQEADTEGKLRATIQLCLRRADELELKRVAFPLMGAGFYGVPAPLSSRVMLEAFREHLASGSVLEEILVCVLDTPQLEAFQAGLKVLP